MMIISNERKDNVNELKKCLTKLKRWELEQLFRDGVRASNLGGGVIKDNRAFKAMGFINNLKVSVIKIFGFKNSTLDSFIEILWSLQKFCIVNQVLRNYLSFTGKDSQWWTQGRPESCWWAAGSFNIKWSTFDQVPQDFIQFEKRTISPWNDLLNCTRFNARNKVLPNTDVCCCILTFTRYLYICSRGKSLQKNSVCKNCNFFF